MATKIEEILGRDINSIKELREEIKRLQDSIANSDKADQEYWETQRKIAAATEQLTSVTRGYKDAVDAASDSIIGMEREYRQYYNTYKMMSEEERNSPLGRETVAHLNELSNKLNETKKEAGNFKDNIGRYSESIIDAFGKMGISLGALQGPIVMLTKMFEEGNTNIINSINNVTNTLGSMSEKMAEMGGPVKAVTSGIQGFGAALKGLMANPIVAWLAAIVVAFKAVAAIVDRTREAINNNEESQMRLKEAMSQFQPVIDAVSNAFDKLGTVVVKVIGFISDAFAKLREIRGAVTDFLGITDGANKRIKEQNALYKELAKAQNNLTKTKREYQKLNAADNAEVQRLREEASEATNLEEKRKLLTEAKDKQAEIDARNIEVAQEELRILEEQSKLTANDAEMNDALAAAVAKVADAEATAANNARRFNKELKGGTSALNSSAGAAKNYREEARKLYEETIEYYKTEEQKLTEKYISEKKQLEKYHFDTKLLTKKYNEDMQKLADDAAKKAAEKRSQELQNRKTDRDKEQDILRETLPLVAVEAQMETLDNAKRKLLELQSIFKRVSSDYAEALSNGNNELAENLYNVLDTYDKAGIEALEGFETAKQLARDINDDFGIAVNTSHSVKNAIKDVKLQIQKLNDEWAELNLEEKFANAAKASNDLELDFVQGDMAGKMESEYRQLIAQNRWEELDTQRKALEQEIVDFRGTYDKKIELLTEYYAVVAEMRDKNVAAEELSATRTQEIWENAWDTFGAQTSSINNIINSYSQLIEAQKNDSKVTEQEAKKKQKTLENLEKVALAVNLAQIMASTVAGVQDIYRSYTAELALNAETAAATGPAAAATKAALDAKSLVSAILRATALISTGAANAAAAVNGTKAKLLQMNDTSSSGPVTAAATVQEINSTPYSYTRTIQTADEYDAIYNKEYFVSVTDINNTQNKVKVREDESSF